MANTFRPRRNKLPDRILFHNRCHPTRLSAAIALSLTQHFSYGFTHTNNDLVWPSWALDIATPPHHSRMPRHSHTRLVRVCWFYHLALARNRFRPAGRIRTNTWERRSIPKLHIPTAPNRCFPGCGNFGATLAENHGEDQHGASCLPEQRRLLYAYIYDGNASSVPFRSAMRDI